MLVVLQCRVGSCPTFPPVPSPSSSSFPQQMFEVALSTLTPMTWPAVMHVMFGPDGLYADLLPQGGAEVVAKLATSEYHHLTVAEKLLLLKALCDASAGCSAVVKVCLGALLQLLLFVMLVVVVVCGGGAGVVGCPCQCLLLLCVSLPMSVTPLCINCWALHVMAYVLCAHPTAVAEPEGGAARGVV
jgi:hypothetical protein